MSRCPTCQAEFVKGEQFCPRDGSPLSQQAPPGDALIGRVLGGRYRLTERLGQGGMGTVYRAVHTLMEKPLAVKILRGELSTDAEAVARFHREARSASRLDHDHCIRVTDFGQTDDGLLYLAMELLEGRSLTRRMRESRLSIAEACSIAHAVALALEHAHEAGIVHRDLKPDNVFLAQRSRGREIVKVLDFGLAKLVSDSGKSRSITRDGTIFGTPEYMAPEQAQGEPLDARTDLYALGILLFQLLTGELPFRADTFVALLTKQVREAPPRPRDLEPSLPPELEAIVLRCMQKRPADRFPSATALIEALSPWVLRADSTGPVTPLPGRDVASGPVRISGATGAIDSLGLDTAAAEVLMAGPRRARRAGLAVAAVGLLIAGFAGVRALRRGEPPTAQATPAPRPSASPGMPELEEVQRLVAAGKLDEAAAQLELLHRKGESAALERVTGEVAERRGRRLEALAHLHRAKTLAPTDPAVRAALAGLLLRLDQKVDACQQARRALELGQAQRAAPAAATGTQPGTKSDLQPSPKNEATVALVRGILKGAACP